jgi:hypothetical protein
MTRALVAPVLGPFRGDQLDATLNAVHPETGAAKGDRRHRSLLVSLPDIAKR